MYFLLSLYIVNCIVSGEIYTVGNNFILPLAVTAWTNLTYADTCFDLFICGSFQAPALFFCSSFQAPAFFKALLPLGEDPDTLGYICAIPLLSRYHISSQQVLYLIKEGITSLFRPTG